MSKIPELFATTSYMLDPETEDMLYGDELKDGMVVLTAIETTREYHGEPLEGLSESKRLLLQTKARWCRVEKLRKRGDSVLFIGKYADGSKRAREYNKYNAWFVKRDSM